MIAAVKGYRVTLCLPSNASLERKRILNAYGAEIVFTNPAEGSMARSDRGFARSRMAALSAPVPHPTSSQSLSGGTASQSRNACATSRLQRPT